jgi:hypothetical protein
MGRGGTNNSNVSYGRPPNPSGGAGSIISHFIVFYEITKSLIVMLAHSVYLRMMESPKIMINTNRAIRMQEKMDSIDDILKTKE